MQNLAPDYLTTVPEKWIFKNNYIYYELPTEGQCSTANGMLNGSETALPLCSELWDTATPTDIASGACCRLDAAELDPSIPVKESEPVEEPSDGQDDI